MTDGEIINLIDGCLKDKTIINILNYKEKEGDFIKLIICLCSPIKPRYVPTMCDYSQDRWPDRRDYIDECLTTFFMENIVDKK